MIEIAKFNFCSRNYTLVKIQQLTEIRVIISCSLRKIYQDIAPIMFKFQYLAIAFANV